MLLYTVCNRPKTLAVLFPKFSQNNKNIHKTLNAGVIGFVITDQSFTNIKNREDAYGDFTGKKIIR